MVINIENIKKEITNLVDTFSYDEIDIKEQKHELTLILKKLIFLKEIYSSNVKLERTYLYCWIEDILVALNEIENANTRYFYFNLRSILENGVRTIKCENIDLISMSKNINQLKKEYKKRNLDKKYIEFMSVIYKEDFNVASEYIHGNNSNISIDVSINLLYSKSLISSYIPQKRINLLKTLNRVMQNLIWIMLPMYYEIIDYVFQNKDYLVYLVNKNYKTELIKLTKK